MASSTAAGTDASTFRINAQHTRAITAMPPMIIAGTGAAGGGNETYRASTEASDSFLDDNDRR